MSTINPLPIDGSRTGTFFTHFFYGPTADQLVSLDHDLVFGSVSVTVSRWSGSAWVSVPTLAVDTAGGNGWYFATADKDLVYSASLGVSVYRGIRVGSGNSPAGAYFKVVYATVGDYIEPADLLMPDQRLMVCGENLGQFKVVAAKVGGGSDTAWLWDKTSTAMEIVGVTVQPEAQSRLVAAVMTVPVQTSGILAMGSGLTPGKKVFATSSGAITQDETTFGATDRKVMVGVAISATEVDLQIGGGASATTSSSSGLNLMQNPLNSANLNGWSRSAGATPVWDTAINIAGGGAMRLDTFISGQYLEGSLVTPVDGALVGQSWKIDMAYKLDSSTYVDGELTAALWDGTTEVAAGNIPAGVTGQIVTTSLFVFPTTTLANLKLRIKAGGSGRTATLRISAVTVAPQQILSVPAVGGWIPYVPTVSMGITGFTSTALETRRVGNTMQGRGLFVPSGVDANTAVLTIPSGISISAPDVSSRVVGRWWRMGFATAGSRKTGVLIASGNNPYNLYFANDDFSTGSAPGTPLGANSCFLAAEVISVEFSFPVAQWSPNIQVSAEAVEYAYNTDATTTAGSTATTGSVSGVEGTNVIAINSATANSMTKKRITWRSPIKPSDRFAVDISGDSGVTWIETAFGNQFISPLTPVYNAIYGMGLIAVDSTHTDVAFGNAGRTFAASGGYGGTGIAWADIVGYKWRVRKISGGSLAEVPPMVRAEYYPSAVAIGATDSVIKLANKIEDTHSAYNSSTGVYTPPVAGVYRITGLLDVGGSRASSVACQIYVGLKINGVLKKYSGKLIVPPANYAAIAGSLIINFTIRLTAADLVTIVAGYSGDFIQATDVFSSSAIFSVTYERIGS